MHGVRDRGIRLVGCSRPEVVELGDGVTEDDLLVHDEKASMAFATMLAHMEPPEFPMPLGVIRRVDAPTREGSIQEQVQAVTSLKGGPGKLEDLIYAGDIWTVK